ncbi:MAG: hypothetical protein ACOCZD_02200, partial [Haloferacaceae archaeon]
MAREFKIGDTYRFTYDIDIDRSDNLEDADDVQLFVDVEDDDGERTLVVNALESESDRFTIVDAEQGTVEYVFEKEETAREGQYRAEFLVTWSDGRRLTDPEQGFIDLNAYETLDREEDIDLIEPDSDLSLTTLYADRVGTGSDPVGQGHFEELEVDGDPVAGSADVDDLESDVDT